MGLFFFVSSLPQKDRQKTMLLHTKFLIKFKKAKFLISTIIIENFEFNTRRTTKQ